MNDTHLLLSRNCHGTNASRKASGTDLSQICLPCVTSNAVRTFPCVSDVPEHAVLSTDGSEHASHVINDPSVNVRFGQVQSLPLPSPCERPFHSKDHQGRKPPPDDLAWRPCRQAPSSAPSPLISFRRCREICCSSGIKEYLNFCDQRKWGPPTPTCVRSRSARWD